MDALKSSKNMTIVGAVVIVALALLFWTQLLSPKRDEAAKLGGQIETTEASLASHRAEVEAAEAARRRFPTEYQRLVVLGKAVPGGDETASLLVQLNSLADRSGVRFNDLQLNSEGGGGSGEEAAAPRSSAGGTPVSATEVAASLLPLGASIGPAGLAVMPYTLTFEGDFFQIADFIEQLDKMVKTQNEKVLVDGRLITVNGFSLSPEGGRRRLRRVLGRRLAVADRELRGHHLPDPAEPRDDGRRDPIQPRRIERHAGGDDHRRRAVKRLKGPDLKMPDVKAPAFLADLYYDLRDRRLLPLLALVLVAIVATPFLLGQKSETTLPPAAEGAISALRETSVPPTSKLTVVEAKPGLRDYRKRLKGPHPDRPVPLPGRRLGRVEGRRRLLELRLGLVDEHDDLDLEDHRNVRLVRPTPARRSPPSSTEGSGGGNGGEGGHSGGGGGSTAGRRRQRQGARRPLQLRGQPADRPHDRQQGRREQEGERAGSAQGNPADHRPARRRRSRSSPIWASVRRRASRCSSSPPTSPACSAKASASPAPTTAS